MIEVEKKFSVTPDIKMRLTQGAELLGEREMNDVYYDTSSYTLTLEGKYLRCRNGAWELKIPLLMFPPDFLSHFLTQSPV